MTAAAGEEDIRAIGAAEVQPTIPTASTPMTTIGATAAIRIAVYSAAILRPTTPGLPAPGAGPAMAAVTTAAVMAAVEVTLAAAVTVGGGGGEVAARRSGPLSARRDKAHGGDKAMGQPIERNQRRVTAWTAPLILAVSALYLGLGRADVRALAQAALARRPSVLLSEATDAFAAAAQESTTRAAMPSRFWAHPLRT